MYIDLEIVWRIVRIILDIAGIVGGLILYLLVKDQQKTIEQQKKRIEELEGKG